MNANLYQLEAFKLALPSTKNLTYMLLGLANEAGEAAGKLKKVMRGDVSLAEVAPELIKELGDVQWYVAGAAEVLRVNLGEVMQGNLDKLHSRQMRGTLQGSGDHR